MVTFGKDALELHDIAAVWCALANPPDSAGTEDGLPSMSPGWAVVRRNFDIERSAPAYIRYLCTNETRAGEHTAGMLIIDRRVRAQSEKRLYVLDPMDPNGLTAQTDMDNLETFDANEGIPCVVETPGPEVLLRLLTKRVWGIDV